MFKLSELQAIENALLIAEHAYRQAMIMTANPSAAAHNELHAHKMQQLLIKLRKAKMDAPV